MRGLLSCSREIVGVATVSSKTKRAKLKSGVLAIEMRNELGGSLIGLAGLVAVTLYTYLAFRPYADPIGLHIWALSMAAILVKWLFGLLVI